MNKCILTYVKDLVPFIVKPIAKPFYPTLCVIAITIICLRASKCLVETNCYTIKIICKILRDSWRLEYFTCIIFTWIMGYLKTAYYLWYDIQKKFCEVVFMKRDSKQKLLTRIQSLKFGPLPAKAHIYRRTWVLKFVKYTLEIYNTESRNLT